MNKIYFMHPNVIKRSLALLTVAVCISAYAENSPEYSIKVSGVVSGLSGGASRTLIINECDISEKSRRCIAELDSLGRFEAVLPFYRGHTFTVNYNRSLFVNAYAEPGDSIFVSIDASKKPVEFHLSGAHSKLNEEYSHAFYDLAPIYYKVNLPPDTVPLSVYMPVFKGEVARTRAIVDKYIREKSLMPETAELLRLDNVFVPANQAIGFEGKGQDEQIAFFTDSIFDIFNPSNPKVMIFPYHLSALMRRDPGLVDRVPKSAIRDLMYATLRDEVPPARDDFENTAYYDRLYGGVKKNIDFSELAPGRIVVLEKDTVYNIDNENPVNWLRKRFPARPVYLDVSATWCGPCRAALMASDDLRKHYADSDIVFTIIWLRSDIEVLKTLAPRINNAIHIFIPDEDMSNRVMGVLNLKGFPSYYFIDRDGEMSSDGVPHFNDSGLVDFLRAKE